MQMCITVDESAVSTTVVWQDCNSERGQTQNIETLFLVHRSPPGYPELIIHVLLLPAHPYFPSKPLQALAAVGAAGAAQCNYTSPTKTAF